MVAGEISIELQILLLGFDELMICIPENSLEMLGGKMYKSNNRERMLVAIYIAIQ